MQIQSITVHVSRKLNPKQFESADYGASMTGVVEPGDTIPEVIEKLTSTVRLTLFKLMEPALHAHGRTEDLTEELGVQMHLEYRKEGEDDGISPR